MVDFNEYFAGNDAAGCVAALHAYKKEERDWSRQIAALTSASLSSVNATVFEAILQALPDKQLMAFSCQILRMENLPESYLQLLSAQAIDKDKAQQTAVFNALAKALILSPNRLTLQDINALLARMSASFLLNTLLALEDLSVDKQETLRSQFTEESQGFYREKLDRLLIALSIIASREPERFYLQMHGQHALANRVALKRLNSLSHTEAYQTIVMELLTQGESYHWRARPFSEKIHQIVLQCMLKGSGDVQHEILKRYLQIRHDFRPGMEEKISLVNALYFQGGEEQALRCIQAMQKADPAFVFHYIQAQGLVDKAPVFTYRVLSELSATALPDLLALMHDQLKQNSGDEPLFLVDAFIQVFSEALNKDQQTTEALQKLFKNLRRYPGLEADFFAKMPPLLKVKPRLLQTFILSAIDCGSSPDAILSATVCLMTSCPGNTALLKPVLLKFQADDFCHLFAQLEQSQASAPVYAGFVQCFQGGDGQSYLSHLLQHAEHMPEETAMSLIRGLDDKPFLGLLEAFIEKTKGNPRYLERKQGCLAQFWQRLVTQRKNEKAIIHTWLESSYCRDIAEALLHQPVFLDYISQSWRVKSPAADFKRSVNAVWNAAKIDDAHARELALALLSHFRKNPVAIRTIFYNLQQSDLAFTALGRENYQRLKKTFWEIIRAKEPYDETQFDACLASLRWQASFDQALRHIAFDSTMTDHPLQAQFLAQMHTGIPLDLSEDEIKALLEVLIHSRQEEQRLNWEKARLWLEKLETGQAVDFMARLIDRGAQMGASQAIYPLVMQYQSFDACLIGFSLSQSLWLIKNSADDRLKAEFPDWFPRLLKHPQKDYQSLALIIAALPRDQALTKAVFAALHAESAEAVAEIWAILSRHARRALFWPYFSNLIASQDLAWKADFLKAAYPHFNEETPPEPVVLLLNALWFTLLPQLSAEDIASKRPLLDKHIQLIYQTVLQNSEESAQWAAHQSLISFLNCCDNVDSHLLASLLSSDAFAPVIKDWLALIEKIPGELAQKRHPLTAYMIEHLSHPALKQLLRQAQCKPLVYQLLTNPKLTLSEDSFALLFDGCDSAMQMAILKAIIRQPYRSKAQNALLPNMSHHEAIDDLYASFSRHPDDSNLWLSLFYHPDLLLLSAEKRDFLWNNLSQGSAIIALLDGHCAIAYKERFVHQLFLYCKQDAVFLANKLSDWGINKTLLGLLANYLTEHEDKKTFQTLLKSYSYYAQLIVGYLADSPDNLTIRLQSFLYDLLLEQSQDPLNKGFAEPRFMQSFQRDRILQAFLTLLDIKKQSHHFSQLVKPLKNCDMVMSEALAVAHWYQRLPLLVHGLLSVAYAYQKAAPSKQTEIQESRLYKKYLADFMFSIADAGALTTKKRLAALPEALKPFQAMPAVQQANRAFCQAQALMKKYLPDAGYRMFSWLDGQSLKLEQLYTDLYENPHSQIAEIDRQLAQMGEIILQDRRFAADPEALEILIPFVLSSPFAMSFDKGVIQSFFQSLPLKDCQQAILTFCQKNNPSDAKFQLLKKLLEQKDLKAVMKCLDVFTKEQLAEISALAAQMQLNPIRDLIHLKLAQLRYELSDAQLESLLIAENQGQKHAIDWINQSLETFNHYVDFIRSRRHILSEICFSYLPGDNKNQQRLHCLRALFPRVFSSKDFAAAFHSYQAVFEHAIDFELRGDCLAIFADVLQKSDAPVALISAISSVLLEKLMDEAVQRPNRSQSLLHQLLNSPYKNSCYDKLYQRLEAILHQNLYSLEDLSPAQARQIKAPLDAEIFALFRLFIMKHPDFAANPILDAADLQGSVYEKQAFVMDLILYQQLVKSKEQLPEAFVQSGMRWLRDRAKNENSAYHGLLCRNIALSPLKFLASYCQWVALQYAVEEDLPAFLENIVFLISEIDAVSDKPGGYQYPPALQQLIEFVLEKDCLDALLKEIQAKKRHMKKSSIDYFCMSIYRTAPLEEKTIEPLFHLASFSCLLQLIKDSEEKPAILLLQTLLKKERSIKALREDPEFQQSLLNLLKMRQFPLLEILHCIEQTENRAMRSLMVIHLLSREDFFKRLPGKSDLTLLEDRQWHKRRLQHLLNDLEISQLTRESMQHLQAEAALNLLCTVRHFHCWSEEKINDLLTKMPEASSHAIDYFIRFYAGMPHVVDVFAHVFNLADGLALQSLEVAEPAQSNPLKCLLLSQAESCSKIIKNSKFIVSCNEAHLIHALRLYKFSHHQRVLEDFIRKLFNRLIEQDNSLSLDTLKNMAMVLHDERLKDLRIKTNALLCQYVRTAAYNGDLSLFYEFDFEWMQAVALLEPKLNAPHGKVSSCFDEALTGLWKAKAPSAIDVSVLPEAVMDEQDRMKLIDYYLLYFQGDRQILAHLLADYFSHGHDAGQYNSTIRLLKSDHLSEPVKEVLFSSLLNCPHLNQSELIYELLVYNCHFSLTLLAEKHPYDAFIPICAEALQRRPQHIPQDGIEDIQRAMAEAEFERELSEISFMSTIRCWFRRCCYYGFQGFFTANMPQIVRPFEYWQGRVLPSVQAAARMPDTMEAALQQALDKNDRNALLQCLFNCNYQYLDEASLLPLRQRVDAWYAAESKKVENADWFKTRAGIFIENRRYILENLFKRSEEEALVYLNKISDSDQDFSLIRTEFSTQPVDWSGLQETIAQMPSEPLPESRWWNILYGAYEVGSNMVRASVGAYSWFMQKNSGAEEKSEARDASMCNNR